MPKFAITSYHPVDADVAEFTVQFRDGRLQVGETFRCFMTHHPVEFRVSSIRDTDGQTVLVCHGRLGFDDEYAGAVVDTSATRKPEAFRYE